MNTTKRSFLYKMKVGSIQTLIVKMTPSTYGYDEGWRFYSLKFKVIKDMGNCERCKWPIVKASEKQKFCLECGGARGEKVAKAKFAGDMYVIFNQIKGTFRKYKKNPVERLKQKQEKVLDLTL